MTNKDNFTTHVVKSTPALKEIVFGGTVKEFFDKAANEYEKNKADESEEDNEKVQI